METARGYQLRPSDLPMAEKNLVKHAVFVADLDRAVELLNLGYFIRMGRRRIPPSNIGREGLRGHPLGGSSLSAQAPKA